MLVPRTKLIEEFRELLIANDHQYIALVAPSGWGKTTFLSLLTEAGIIDASQTVYATALDVSTFSNPKPKTIIFDGDIIPDIYDIRTFVESELIDSKVIYSTETLWTEPDVSYFQIPWISFREYSEWYGNPVEIGVILSGTADIGELNSLRDDYIHLGQYGKNISDPENLEDIWNDKISIMVEELFEKEKDDFIEYIRTLALGVGDLFKEDRIAKMMSISRRKVRKYTELLMKHGFVRAIGPFGDSPDTELFRHVKIYFCDLSFLAIALGVGYYHGPSKQWVIENFIFLELDRKLSLSHDIRFYRKKSGAEVSFVLIDKQSSLITPIDITIRPTDIVPQALRLFAETYSDRIERIMFMNEERVWQKELNWKTLITLPHVAI
jgi:predicted AAA+ superfamily ATPase